MKQLEKTSQKLRWSLRAFAVSLIVALGAAFWQGRLLLGWLPEHPDHSLYVLLGYVKTLGSVAWFMSGGASVLFFFERRADRKKAEREREEERAKARAEWDELHGNQS